MYVYLLLVAIAFVSFPTLGMESPIITTVTEEEGTSQEEAKIEENEKRQGDPAAGVSGNSSPNEEDIEEITPERINFGTQRMSTRFARKITDQNADQDSIRREEAFAKKVFNVLSTITLSQKNLLHPETEGFATGKILAHRDYEHAKTKATLFLKHPFVSLCSLGIQGIETGIIQGSGHVIAKLIIAGSDKVGNAIHSRYSTTGRKLSIDIQSQEIMAEIELLSNDKRRIDQLKRQGFQSDKTKFYDQQISLITSEKFDEWTDKRLNRWGLKYAPKDIVPVPSKSLSPSIVDSTNEDEEPVLMNVNMDTDYNAIPN